MKQIKHTVDFGSFVKVVLSIIPYRKVTIAQTSKYIFTMSLETFGCNNEL